MTPDRPPIVVVGAGVAGLACAVTLAEAGLPVRVIEAHAVAGGRVRSVWAGGRVVAELGPSWVWPRWQPTLARWLARLDIATVPQHDAGDAVIERGPGLPLERAPLAVQDGIRRIVGGPGALVDALVARLPIDTLMTSSPVLAIRAGGAPVQLELAGGSVMSARAVLVAAAPRIALQHIAYEPSLPASLVSLLGAAPTWMAAQAKAVAVYATPFWRADGLSGRVASAVGPLVEIHDHCGPGGDPAALFGFVAVPVEARRAHPDRLRCAIVEQLGRCFGPAGQTPSSLHLEDWAEDRFVCSESDRAGEPRHPTLLASLVREPLFEGRLRFCGSETASLSPGLLEGALSAGQQAAHDLLRVG